MILEGKIINFLGDSITEGYGTTSADKRFFEVMRDKYGMKEANGYGIGGTKIAKQLQPGDNPDTERYFASRIDDMKDADAVVVFGGTNDFGQGDAPIGNFSDRTPCTFYGACHDLFTRLILKYPGKPIIVITPLHRKEENDVRTKHGTEVTLLTYVDIIREVAAYYSVPVCDLYRISGLQPNVQVICERFMPDGLHPNDEGHEIIAERLGNFLKSL